MTLALALYLFQNDSGLRGNNVLSGLQNLPGARMFSTEKASRLLPFSDEEEGVWLLLQLPRPFTYSPAPPLQLLFLSPSSSSSSSSSLSSSSSSSSSSLMLSSCASLCLKRAWFMRMFLS